MSRTAGGFYAALAEPVPADDPRWNYAVVTQAGPLRKFITRDGYGDQFWVRCPDGQWITYPRRCDDDWRRVSLGELPKMGRAS